MKKYSKGFTLIELLVVIAIIGILSSVVLASLNTARNKGSDAAVKSGLASLRANMELAYDTNGGSYVVGTTCTGGTAGQFASTSIAAQLTNIESNNSGDLTCFADSGKWAVSTALKTTGSTWCIDSSGASMGTASSTGASDGAC